MKASVCVLFAVACWLVSQADESPIMRFADDDESLFILTLDKVMNDLGKINKAMGKSTTLIYYSPIITNDLTDCCIASALEYFRNNMIRMQVSYRLKKVPAKISRDLGKQIILNGLPICTPEETQKAQCESSYREVNSQTFMQNFQTLLQKLYRVELYRGYGLSK